MSSSDVTTRKPGSASDWLPCLIYSPSADNLNNFIAKRRAFEENRELMSQFLRVLVIIATTVTRQQKTLFGVMGGTPLRNRRDRRLHSVTKSLNLSPQRS